MKKKNSYESLQNLAKFLSGEASAEKRAQHLEEVKKSALKKQKTRFNKAVESGQTSLEDEKFTEEELKFLGIKEEKIVQKIKLYEWDAPIRVTFPFDKKAFMGVVAACLTFILYLAILGHYGLMFAIAALLFFIYVAGTTEPVHTTHIITSQGIDTFDKLYEWFKLRSFWFSKKNGQLMLIVETKLRTPGLLIMIITEEQKGAIFTLLQERLLYKEIKKESWIYKATYGEYIPIEKI